MSDPEPIVYVIDDDTAIRQSLKWLMQSVGLNVSVFSAAQDFLEGHDPSRPGCLILDLRMPGMSGLELQDHLASREVELPIVFITGHAEVPTAVRAMKNGAVDFIEKPFSDHALLECVQRALRKDARERQQRRDCAAQRARLKRLTPRERQVVELVVEGLANKQIAVRLGVSEKTVEVHRAHAMGKTKARGVAELVRVAMHAEHAGGIP